MQHNNNQPNAKFSRLNSAESAATSEPAESLNHRTRYTNNNFPQAPPFPGTMNQSSSSSSSSSSAAAYFSANQDFLNSSQSELGWLNSSLNLPAEQRYQSLNDMVSRIVEDDIFMNSGNSSQLNFSFRNFPQSSLARQFSTGSNLSRQNSSETSKIPMADNYPILKNAHQSPRQPAGNGSNQPVAHSTGHHQMRHVANQPGYQTQQQFHANSAWIPAGYGLPNESGKNPAAFAINKDQQNFSGAGPPLPPSQQPLMNPLYQLHLMQMQQKNTKIFSPNDAFNKFLVPQLIQQNYPSNFNGAQENASESNKHNNSSNRSNKSGSRAMPIPVTVPASNYSQAQSELYDTSRAPQATAFYPPPPPPSNESLFNMPLAFPTSVAHHFATLSPEQQNYLLQQQQQLFMYLAMNDPGANRPYAPGMAPRQKPPNFRPNPDFGKKSAINTLASNVPPSPTSPSFVSRPESSHGYTNGQGTPMDPRFNANQPNNSRKSAGAFNQEMPQALPRSVLFNSNMVGGTAQELAAQDEMAAAMFISQQNFHLAQLNMIPRHVVDNLPSGGMVPFNMEDINMK